MNHANAFSVSSFCLHPSSFSSLASYGSRTRSNTSTGCHAIRYTNETQSHQPGEQGNRTLATTFTVSRAATTPNSPTHLGSRRAPLYMRGFDTRKRRDSNPHRPTERPRLANACDETDIRLSSKAKDETEHAWL